MFAQIERMKNLSLMLGLAMELNNYYLISDLRWCLHDTGMNFIPERLAWFVSRLHGRSHSGMKML